MRMNALGVDGDLSSFLRELLPGCPGEEAFESVPDPDVPVGTGSLGFMFLNCVVNQGSLGIAGQGIWWLILGGGLMEFELNQVQK